MNDEHRINITLDEPAAPAAENDTAVKYASIAERFVALTIDYGIVFLPLSFLAWIIGKCVGNYLESWQITAFVIGVNGVFVLYETIFSSGGRVTLGKNLVGIAVVDKEMSGPISMGRAFLRALGYYASALLFFGGFVLAFVDDRKRALHDFFGGSVVVQLRQRDWWETLLVRGVGVILLIAFVSALYHSFGGRDWQNKYKVDQARSFIKKVALLEEGHKVRYGYYTTNLNRLALLSGDPVHFQRDMQRVFAKGMGNFRIGVAEDSYKIVAFANDKKHTLVSYTKK